MVSGLEPTLQDPGPAAGILCSVRKHLSKKAFGHMMGAGTSDKDAAGSEQSHGAIVDFFVPTKGPLKTLLILGESRRIQDDHVVSGALLVFIPEVVEGIGFDRFDIRQPISFGVAANHFNSSRRNIDGVDTLATVTDLKRESAAVSKCVERLPVRNATRSLVIVTLVELRACLLTATERHGDLLPVLVDDECFRYRSADNFLFELKAFEFADPAIISKQNGRMPLLEDLCK